MNALRNFIELLEYKFTIGSSISFSPKSILIVILVFVLTFFSLKLFRKIINRTLSSDAKIKFRSIFSFFNYFVYSIVILMTFQNIGINLTAVFAASAALLVGVGLALQTFIQDIISGVFIIVDQSVHVNDIIEVDGQIGKVENIKLRTTRAVTRENKVLIITKEIVEIGVSYKSDVKQVTDILLGIANSHKSVLTNPKPTVIFNDFGDSALIFQLYFALDSSFASNIVKSDLRYEIFEEFNRQNIDIPFPQRTLTFVNPPKTSST